MTKTAARAKNFPLEIKAIADLFQGKLNVLRETFLESKDIYNAGFEFQHKYSDLIDKTIQSLANFCFKGITKSSTPVIVALGGYGRKELAPTSDIDIVFVQDQPFNRQTKKLIEQLNSHFWSAGLKISASARSLKDCETAMDEDMSFLTSLLEKRLVWGPKATYLKLEKAFQKHIKKTPPAYFVTTKLEERDVRHRKMGDSRYQLEPNIKEGKGALRDIHTLLWIANFLYGVRKPEDMVKKDILSTAEAATLKKAQHFFWTVRCHMHLLAGRGNDRLSFDSQPLVAALMGYKEAEPNVRAEKFMKDYFLLAREVGHLTRILCAKIESQSLKAQKLVLEDVVEGFPVKGNRLTVGSANVFKKSPVEIIRIFRVSQTSGIDIHPDALRHIRNGLETFKHHRKETYPMFLEILLDPIRAEQTLRRMNEADVLGALIPEFKNIVAHMQYDMYHSFTADEHLIHAIGMMHRIENGELATVARLATDLFPKIKSRRALYAAIFLHDIAKSASAPAPDKKPGPEGHARHSVAGAKVAKEICPLLGLSPEETETVSWLVHEHLTMTMTAFKRDLNDEKTIEDFIAVVQSPERLKLLTILTTADIMAVGPERWNNWKSGLLSDLYHKSVEAMSDVKAPLTHLLPKNDNYEKGKTLIKITPHPKQDHTEVTVTTADRQGLFAILSGAMAASGASIVAARIFTLSNGMVQDVFQIQNLKGHVYDNNAFLNKTIKAALDGKLDLNTEIRERQKTAPKKTALFKNLPRVIIDNDASVSNTVIEVNGGDRPGFLYAITSALTRQGLQISAAKVTTFGSRAVDVFYVRDNFGLKILHPGKLKTIENSLKQELERGY